MIDNPKELPDINIAYNEYVNSQSKENYEKIFLAADRLIDKFVNSFKQIKNKSDLTQSGYLGLVKAINSYKEDAGTKFSTWASTCIISEIRHEIRREQRFFNLQNKSIQNESAGLLSLSSSEDGRPAIEEADLKAEIATNEHMDLKLILSKLSKLDRQIVELLFYKDYSQEEVAKLLNITQKKVSRQKAKVIGLLQVEMVQSFKLTENKNSFKLK